MVERVYISQSGGMSMADELAAMRSQEQSKAQATWRDYDASNFQSVTMDSRPGIKPVQAPGMPLSPNGAVVYTPNSKTVFINGMETSREVAERMGWIPDQGQSVSPFAGSAEHQEAHPQTQDAPQVDDRSSAERAGDEALDKLMNGFSGDAGAAINEGVETGDFEALAVKHGLEATSIQAVIAGATARADRVIAETGINIATASHVLSAAELAEARRAVVNGDDGRLQAIAAKAANNLASMPERDPKGFAEFWNAHFGDYNHDVGPKGQFLVAVEGMGHVPWATAVRLGAVKI